MIRRVVQQKDSNAHPASLSYNVGRTFKLKAQPLATALTILSAKKMILRSTYETDFKKRCDKNNNCMVISPGCVVYSNN